MHWTSASSIRSIDVIFRNSPDFARMRDRLRSSQKASDGLGSAKLTR